MGSGAGVKQVIRGVVDFGGSDVGMTPEEISEAKYGALMLPMTAGAVVLAYNLPDLKEPLRLSRTTSVREGRTRERPGRADFPSPALTGRLSPRGE